MKCDFGGRFVWQAQYLVSLESKASFREMVVKFGFAHDDECSSSDASGSKRKTL